MTGERLLVYTEFPGKIFLKGELKKKDRAENLKGMKKQAIQICGGKCCRGNGKGKKIREWEVCLFCSRRVRGSVWLGFDKQWANDGR